MDKTTKLIYDLPFSLFSRYRALAQSIDRFRFKRRRFKILEVGGRGNYLRLFLPNDSITILDIDDSDEKNYVKGDGRALPFVDSSFDLVVSTDVLEHIPSEDRRTFLKEQIRVARRAVVLAAPFFSREKAQIERRANRLYRLSAGKKHPWLEDHINYGLPREKEIEQYLKKKKLLFTKQYNQNLNLWSQLIYIDLLVSANYTKEVKAAFNELNQFYNKHVFPFDMGYSGYRTIYTIAADPRIDIEKTIIRSSEAKTISRETLQKLFSLGVSVLIEIHRINQSTIHDKDRHIANLDSIIIDLKKDFQKLECENSWIRQQVILLEFRQKELVLQIQKIEESRIFSLLKFISKIFDFLVRKPIYIVKHASTLLRLSIRVFREEGPVAFVNRTFIFCRWLYGRGVTQSMPDINRQYQEWLIKNMLTQDKINIYKRKMRSFRIQPTISVITPIYKTPVEILHQTVDSVMGQIYPNWELCLVDDGSNDPNIDTYLQSIPKNPRVHIKQLPKNKGIVGATNTAISMATGGFVAFLDHDDTLSSDALYHVVETINHDPMVDMLYSDEDKIDQGGKYLDPYFKPDWSPHLLLSQMYTPHFAVYRKSLGDKIGWSREGFDGSQDYDLALRFTEKTKQIVHIPLVLYHWRKIEGSTSFSVFAKPFTQKVSLRAINETLKRRDIEGKAQPGLQPGTFRVSYKIIGKPKVSIIIPTRDQVQLLSQCVESIISRTTYQNYEVIILDNQSKEPTTKRYFKATSKDRRIRLVSYDSPFNFSAINNFGARLAKGRFLLFLNNDAEVINGIWLESMLELAQLKDVGAVGAKLLYPNNTIQHAGIILGIKGVAGHSHKYIPDSFPGYFSLKDIIREYSAVTAACLMIEKKKFNEIGGFDPQFKIAFNDVDFCLRLRRVGYLNLYTPYAKLYHHESSSVGIPGSASRDLAEFEKETNLLKARYSRILNKDPYYNPNLTRTTEGFGIAT